MIRRHLYYIAEIGDWSKTICFENIVDIPCIFFEVLNFRLTRFHDTNVSPDIIIEQSCFREKRGVFFLKKSDRFIFYKNFKRCVATENFQVKILKNMKHVLVSDKIEWDFLADLLESWVGFLYEKNGGLRIHAVAFKNNVFIANSGFGKTYLANQFYSQLIADEVLYINSDMNRIENKKSVLRFKDKSGSWHCRYGSRRIVSFEASPCKLPVVHLADTRIISVIVGLGLPQHLEFNLLCMNVPTFFKIVILRTKFIVAKKLLLSKVLTKNEVVQILSDN